MIRFANNQTKNLVRSMWQICFSEETPSYLDIYFNDVYKNENTLICFADNKAVASLQLIPYLITFYGNEIPFYYVSGVCTLPEYRGKGYSSQLLKVAHKLMHRRKMPLSILIAEHRLYGFYRKLGYEQVFERDTDKIPLKEIINNNLDIHTAYKEFDSLFRNRDFTVQKSFSDFKIIVKEFIDSDFPEKNNVDAMARIIDIKKLLAIFALNNREKKFIIRINETSQLYYQYSIEYGKVKEDYDNNYDIQTDISLLTRLIFGYKTTLLEEPFRTLFPENKPAINLMLD